MLVFFRAHLGYMATRPVQGAIKLHHLGAAVCAPLRGRTAYVVHVAHLLHIDHVHLVVMASQRGRIFSIARSCVAAGCLHPRRFSGARYHEFASFV